MARKRKDATKKAKDVIQKPGKEVPKLVPEGTLWRLPKYLAVSRTLESIGWDYVTSADLARACEVKEVLVRKDLSWVRASGRPRLGYPIGELCCGIEEVVGWNRPRKLAVVGPTILAEALQMMCPLKAYNLELAYVVDDANAGGMAAGVRVLSLANFVEHLSSEPVGVALVSSSAEQAQSLVNRLVAAGVKAVWNFAPTTLAVPNDVCAVNADIASGLALLCHRISRNGL